MIFMVAFIVLCVLSIRDARAISKLRQRVRVLELRDVLNDINNVTQPPASDPAQLE